MMKKSMIPALLAMSALTSAGVAVADGDAAAGEARAAVCAACHGANGISSSEMWPNLAGQKAGYLVKQLQAYRDGTRKDPSMGAMAESLSDEDIGNLAAYYSQLSAQ